MGSYYLTWLADELRLAGLMVVECDGWETRSRSSGGFEPGRPWCVMWHHTASSAGTPAANDVGYMLNPMNDAYPTANLYVARDGEVWVMCGGASNTNGKGSGERLTSSGTVPIDSMNTYAVGIEIGNNGVGEPYSKACIDAAFATSITVTNKLGLQPDDVIHHQAYAPDRKVDPATCTGVQGGWYPHSISSSGTWSLSDLKNECLRRATTSAVVEPPSTTWIAAIPELGDTMFIAVKDGVYWIGNGVGRRQLKDNAEVDFLIDKFDKAGTPLKNFQGGQNVYARSDIAGAEQMNRLGVSVT